MICLTSNDLLLEVTFDVFYLVVIDLLEQAVPPAASASHYGSRAATLAPTITTPVYSTAVRAASTSGPVAFTERFRTTEGPPMESMYTLAHAAETDVQRELGHEQEVSAGVSLMEALATKGIGPRTSSLSSASGSDASTGHVSDSAFSPRHEQSTGGGTQLRPAPKPRTSTMVPLSERLSASDVSGSSTRDNAARAEMQQNGYMRPRQIPNPTPNYDQLPIGPPRPAHSPRHKSALLRDEAAGSSARKSSPTYINMLGMAASPPPLVDRTIKPLEPSPPRVDRKKKPRLSQTSESSPGSGEMPPKCPTRMSSLSASRHDSQDMEDSLAELQLQSSATRSSVSSTSLGDDDTFVDFNATDLPRHSRSTLKYTQVNFDDATGKATLTDPLSSSEASCQPSDGEDSARRLPVPVPRPGISRVNYSDVDLAATRTLAEASKATKKNQVTLVDAERQAMKEKPYINVKRDGVVDDNSDPDYYTFMRVSHVTPGYYV